MMRLSIFIFVYVALASCQKQNLNNARASITGSWRVAEIYSDQKDTSGIHHDGRHWETGDLGVFTFSENTASYAYNRLDSVYEATADWDLTREKVKEGFHKVERYTLRVGALNFDCAFGDGTSDAEKDADRVVLSYETKTAEPNFILTLIKQ